MNDNRTVAQSRLITRKKGFTLTEIAIVLGIIGLILGAIWTAASGVYNSNRIGVANTELLTVVQGAQTLYSTQSSFGTGGTALTSAIAVAGYSPSSLTNGAVIYNPWNGNSGVASGNGLLFVDANTITVAGDAVTVVFSYIPASACVAILTNASGTAGYYSYKVAVVTAATAKGTTAPTDPAAVVAGTTGVVTAAAAQTACGTTFDTLSLVYTKG